MWFQEKFEDTKAVIRSRTWTKNRQYPNEKVYEIHTKKTVMNSRVREELKAVPTPLVASVMILLLQTS